MPLRFVLDEDTRDTSLWQAIADHNEREPAYLIDAVRVGDANAPPTATPDAALVEWSVTASRVIVSRDRNTLIDTHSHYVRRGNATPGLLILRGRGRPADIAESLALIAHFSDPGQFASTTQFIPLNEL
jgi:hypothetical protein